MVHLAVSCPLLGRLCLTLHQLGGIPVPADSSQDCEKLYYSQRQVAPNVGLTWRAALPQGLRELVSTHPATWPLAGIMLRHMIYSL